MNRIDIRVRTLVTLFPRFLARFWFDVDFAFITGAMFALDANDLRALLFATTAYPTGAKAYVTIRVGDRYLDERCTHYSNGHREGFTRDGRRSVS